MLTRILATLMRKGYFIYTRTFELNIIGVRSNNVKPNSFDDTIHVFYKREDREWIIHSSPATTDPGTYWLKNLMNLSGTAILKPGQYKDSHCIGLHRGKYPALVQQHPVTVWRDANTDEMPDFNNAKEETGLFGINIHRALLNGVTKCVDKYSAGCQVLADINDFNLLMQLANRHKKLYGNNITYTLIEEKELQ